MAAAGAFSADGDAFAIHAELVGIFVEPAQRGVIIFERAGEMSFRREAIVHRNDQASAILCHGLQKRIELSGEAGDKPAAMHVQKCRTPFGARSRIDNHQAQVRRARWTGDVPFKWLRRRRRQRRHRRPFAYDSESFAGEALRGERELLDGGQQLRIDQGVGVGPGGGRGAACWATAERSNSGAMPIPIPAVKPPRTKSRLVSSFIVDSRS